VQTITIKKENSQKFYRIWLSKVHSENLKLGFPLLENFVKMTRLGQRENYLVNTKNSANQNKFKFDIRKGMLDLHFFFFISNAVIFNPLKIFKF